jgi:hypothetical protein
MSRPKPHNSIGQRLGAGYAMLNQGEDSLSHKEQSHPSYSGMQITSPPMGSSRGTNLGYNSSKRLELTQKQRAEINPNSLLGQVLPLGSIQYNRQTVIPNEIQDHYLSEPSEQQEDSREDLSPMRQPIRRQVSRSKYLQPRR